MKKITLTLASLLLVFSSCASKTNATSQSEETLQNDFSLLDSEDMTTSQVLPFVTSLSYYQENDYYAYRYNFSHATSDFHSVRLLLEISNNDYTYYDTYGYDTTLDFYSEETTLTDTAVHSFLFLFPLEFIAETIRTLFSSDEAVYLFETVPLNYSQL